MRFGTGPGRPFKLFGAFGAITALVVMTTATAAVACPAANTAGPPTANGVQPIYHRGNITRCPAGTTTFINTSDWGNGQRGASYSDDGATFVTKVDRDGIYLSFFATNSPSLTIYVKGGPAYNTYDYTSDNPAYFSDKRLHAPYNGGGQLPEIGHYLVCGQPVSEMASPQLVTSPSAGGPAGSVVLNDAATLTRGSSPSGSITFDLYNNAGCTGTPFYTTSPPITVSGNGTYTTANTRRPPIWPGRWSWTASYSGDSNNNPASSTCGHETVAVTKASPSLTTSPSAGGIAGAVVLNDTARLSGGFQPGGSITFDLFDNATCTGTPVYTTTPPITVSGNGDYTTTNATPASHSGTWSWTASDTGDGHNNTALSGCGSEPVTVTSKAPTLTTTPSAGGTVGAVVLNDTATLSGASSPTGTITFSLYSNSSCSGTPFYTTIPAIAVTGDGDYKTANTTPANAAGTWYWTASYSGDATNNPVSSSCGLETVEVAKASPTFTTSPGAGGTVDIAVLNDTATLGGGFQLGGSITFSLYSNSACTGTPFYTTIPAIAVTGNGEYTTANTTPANAAGTWYWTASYNGDSNNNGATSGCGAETVQVAKASPTLTTTPSPAGTVGTVVLNDTGTVGAGFQPGGTVTFSLYSNSACTGTPFYTTAPPIAVTGNGDYTTANTTPANAAGTWYWTASYSGDSNNNSASSACGAETVVVAKASPTLSTTPSPGGTAGSGRPQRYRRRKGRASSPAGRSPSTSTARPTPSALAPRCTPPHRRSRCQAMASTPPPTPARPTRPAPGTGRRPTTAMPTTTQSRRDARTSRWPSPRVLWLGDLARARRPSRPSCLLATSSPTFPRAPGLLRRRGLMSSTLRRAASPIRLSRLRPTSSTRAPPTRSRDRRSAPPTTTTSTS